MVATCGSDAKAELLRRLGADRVINYRKESLKEVVRREYPKVCPYKTSVPLRVPQSISCSDLRLA